MADITMCEDKECSKSQDCYRFTAPANTWRQAYFMESPRKDNECNEFVPNKLSPSRIILTTNNCCKSTSESYD